MNARTQIAELVFLVSDADLENTIAGVLSRPEVLGIRHVRTLIRRHQGRDPGCRTHGVDFLRMYSNTVAHAILIFDLHGSGGESSGTAKLEADLERRLSANGWGDRAAAVVIEPELENWVWSESRQVDRILGWSNRIPTLRDWLVEEGFTAGPDSKPGDPKAAFHRALRIANKRPSPALFRELAERVSFSHCTDRAFVKLLERLRAWFPRSA